MRRKKETSFELYGRSYSLISSNEMCGLLKEVDLTMREVMKTIAKANGMTCAAYINMVLVKHLHSIGK